MGKKPLYETEKIFREIFEKRAPRFWMDVTEEEHNRLQWKLGEEMGKLFPTHAYTQLIRDYENILTHIDLPGEPHEFFKFLEKRAKEKGLVVIGRPTALHVDVQHPEQAEPITVLMNLADPAEVGRHRITLYIKKDKPLAVAKALHALSDIINEYLERYSPS